ASGVLIAIRGRNLPARVVIACQAAMALSLIAVGLAQSVWLLGLFLFAAYGFSQWGSIASRTLWQSEVAPEMRGRVFALLSASSAAVVPLASIGAPMLAELLIQPWLANAGASSGAAAMLGSGPGRAAGVMIAIMAAAL